MSMRAALSFEILLCGVRLIVCDTRILTEACTTARWICKLLALTKMKMFVFSLSVCLIVFYITHYSSAHFANPVSKKLEKRIRKMWEELAQTERMAGGAAKRWREEDEKTQSGKHIPHELIMEILGWSPAKSLGQFRCVTSLWLSCLTNPEFINKHALQVKDDPKLLLFCSKTRSFYNVNAETYYFNHKMLNAENKFVLPWRHYTDFKLVGSCNGLICLNHESFYFVFNPLIKESRRVFYFQRDYSSAVAAHGFGYDLSTQDHKIVRIQFSKKLLPVHTDGCSVEIDVFSLKNDCWRTLHQEIENVPAWLLTDASPVQVAGILHWQIYLLQGPAEYVLTYDLAKDKCGALANVPEDRDEDHKIVGVSVFNECLCVIRKSLSGEGFTIWSMKSYGAAESWTKLIHLKQLYLYYPIELASLQLNPICKAKKGKLLLLQNFDLDIIYDVEDESSCICKLPTDGIYAMQRIFAYVETLVSPN